MFPPDMAKPKPPPIKGATQGAAAPPVAAVTPIPTAIGKILLKKPASGKPVLGLIVSEPP